MKTLKLFIVALFLSMIGAGNSAEAIKRDGKKNAVIITIHFKNHQAADTLDLYLWDAQNFEQYQKIYRKKISNDACSFALNIDHPVTVGLMLEETSLYSSDKAHYAKYGDIVAPGDRLHLEVGENMDMGIQNIHFSGTGAKKYRLIQELITRINGKSRKLPINMSIDELFAQADSDRQESLRIIGKYKTQLSPLDYELLKFESIDHAYHSAISRLLSSPTELGQMQKYQRRIVRTRKELTSIIACYDLSNLLLMRSLAYLEHMFKTGKAYDRSYYSAHPYREYQIIKSAYNKNRQVCEAMLSQYVASAIVRKGLNAEKEKCALDLFHFTKRTGTNYRQVAAIFQLYKNSLSSGNKAYGFALPDTNGHIIRQADFKGRLMVIDFFFNGCVGCITTAPILDSLETIYENKPVAFVSVSADRTKQQWKKGIGIFSSKRSIQLFTEGKTTEHPMIRYYQVSTYPTIVLVGKDGDVITARAPDPRTPDGWKALCSLLDAELSKQ